MAQAKRESIIKPINKGARVAAKKKKEKPAVEKTTPRSEIIEQCVIYAQSIAAYQAGFKVDSSGEFDYAGSDKGQHGRRHCRQAERALLRLVELCPAKDGERPLLSREEMRAKAGVLSIIGKNTTEFTITEKIEGAYIRCFALELDDYFREAIEDAWRAERSKADVEATQKAHAKA
jgi:hypothetical protein